MPHGRPGVWVSQALSRPLPAIVDVFGLRQNSVVLSLAIFGVGLGEELWARFLPTYPEALGASVLAIGAFGTPKASWRASTPIQVGCWRTGGDASGRWSPATAWRSWATGCIS